MQRYKIFHRTYYNFSAAVWLEPHEMRLRPREGHELRIESSSLEISPPATLQGSNAGDRGRQQADLLLRFGGEDPGIFRQSAGLPGDVETVLRWRNAGQTSGHDHIAVLAGHQEAA